MASTDNFRVPVNPPPNHLTRLETTEVAIGKWDGVTNRRHRCWLEANPRHLLLHSPESGRRLIVKCCVRSFSVPRHRPLFFLLADYKHPPSMKKSTVCCGPACVPEDVALVAL